MSDVLRGVKRGWYMLDHPEGLPKWEFLPDDPDEAHGPYCLWLYVADGCVKSAIGSDYDPVYDAEADDDSGFLEGWRKTAHPYGTLEDLLAEQLGLNMSDDWADKLVLEP